MTRAMMEPTTLRLSTCTGRTAAAIGGLLLALAVAGTAAADNLDRRESRIQDIEARMTEMQALLRQMRPRRRSPRAAPAGRAPRAVARRGERGVSLTLSGHVNRGVLLAHDGRDLNVFHVDNDQSSTRMRLVAKARPSEDIGVGAQIEVQFESNSTSVVNQIDKSDVGPDNFTERKIEAWIDHARLGRLTLGQGNTASFGVTSQDLSGTRVAGSARVDIMAGGMLFARRGVAPGLAAVSLASPSVGGAFDSLNGLGRDDRIRYDTPRWMGVWLSASHGSEDGKDLAARYVGKLGPVQVASGFAFARDADDFNQYSGSISALHQSGLNAAVAAGTLVRHTAAARDNADFWYVKLGFLFDPFAFGATAISVDYERNTDILVAGDRGHAYGAQFVQNLERAATELYLGVRKYSYEQETAEFDDILAILTGARVKF